MTKEEIKGQLNAYREALGSGDVEMWIANFAADASVEDPVGGPVLKGHDQLRNLFKGLGKTFSQVEMKEAFTVVTSSEAVVKWTTVGVTPAGLTVSFEGISMYNFSADGKITQMRAFWDAKALAKQFKP